MYSKDEWRHRIQGPECNVCDWKEKSKDATAGEFNMSKIEQSTQTTTHRLEKYPICAKPTSWSSKCWRNMKPTSSSTRELNPRLIHIYIYYKCYTWTSSSSDFFIETCTYNETTRKEKMFLFFIHSPKRTTHSKSQGPTTLSIKPYVTIWERERKICAHKPFLPSSPTNDRKGKKKKCWK